MPHLLAIKFFGYLAIWLSGFLAFWLFGFLAIWLSGYLAFWLFGFLAFIKKTPPSRAVQGGWERGPGFYIKNQFRVQSLEFRVKRLPAPAPKP
jgi:hypothetical protein